MKNNNGDDHLNPFADAEIISNYSRAQTIEDGTLPFAPAFGFSLSCSAVGVL